MVAFPNFVSQVIGRSTRLNQPLNGIYTHALLANLDSVLPQTKGPGGPTPVRIPLFFENSPWLERTLSQVLAVNGRYSLGPRDCTNGHIPLS
ncbi:unnamed protein product [Penicillium roqueforti FM164]|uniref:Genomic scaffold, ProqFM164S02 n=1 Tax=Penicillium roqueforti (strain FM164) TaxID=1365484 RepID=W6QD26_PENRF|nr:unnamed protein product [Penicillium roqueforti FM164]